MVDLFHKTGEVVGSVELDPNLFGIEPNMAVMYQVVVAQRAAARAGTHKTKTRAQVRGGGAKPWRQKGTGRARQGSIRSPQWVGGGVVHGPTPRSYAQSTPKKMVRLALRSALSDRAQTDRVRVLDEFGFAHPSTKEAKALLAALSVEKRVVVVLHSFSDENSWKSFRNLPLVHILSADQVNTYDVLRSDWLIFSQESLSALSTCFSGTPEGSSADSVEKEVAV